MIASKLKILCMAACVAAGTSCFASSAIANIADGADLVMRCEGIGFMTQQQFGQHIDMGLAVYWNGGYLEAYDLEGGRRALIGRKPVVQDERFIYFGDFILDKSSGDLKQLGLYNDERTHVTCQVKRGQFD